MDFKKSEYSVRMAENEEIPAINSLLERSFHHEDPFFYCLLARYRSTFTEEDLSQLYEETRKIIESVILESSCLVVVHEETGKIVGVNILNIGENPNNLVPAENPDDEVDVYKTYSSKSPVLRDYIRYANDIIDRTGLFSSDKFSEARRFAELYALAVDQEHRKRGLSTLLIREAINIVLRDKIADVLFGVFSSPFSKRAAAKVGLENVMDVDLLEYRDAADGSRIFEESIADGHNVISVMAMETRMEDSRQDIKRNCVFF